MSEYGPFYGCQFEECRQDRTYELEDLRAYEDAPICEGCYDNVQPVLDGNQDPVGFYDLPKWYPENTCPTVKDKQIEQIYMACLAEVQAKTDWVVMSERIRAVLQGQKD